jgi:hypothetical protein
MKESVDEFEKNLTAGIQKAIDKMLTRARKLDEYVVIADEHGRPKRVRARDLPERK